MASEPPRRYIVGIGVGEYDLPQLRLPKVASDVNKVTAWFQRHPRCAHEHALPELGDNPTWEAMQSGLRRWLAERRPDDVVVIYLAAHGEYEAGRAYLFGRNTPARQLAGAALEAQTFGAMLGQFRAHNVLVIIDACVAGKLASQIQRAAEDAADESNTREPQRAWAQVLLCSTFGRDPALDGLFAQAFVDVVNSEKWTGTTRPWIDIDQLMRGLNEELRAIAAPQVAERKVWGPSPAELIPNPNFAMRTLGTLVAEEELAAHFDPSARGVSRGEAGSFFTGRTQELRRIVAWLAADPAAGGLMVLTGSPGSGKSALLSRAIVLSDPALRQRVGDLSTLPADTLPPLNAFDGVVWCHNKSLRQVVGEIGQRLGRSVDSAAALLDAALLHTDEGQRLTLAIDALDEALPGDAAAIAEQVIAPLAALPGLRVLTATRRQPVRGAPDALDLIGRLRADPAHTLVLDQAIDKRRDMRGYVGSRLAAGSGLAAARYRDDAALADRVAERVVDAAGSSFLVAAITAKTLAAADTPADADTLALPSAVGDAMAAYIDRLADPQRVRDVLRPLAWANGAGLPWGVLWPPLATSLAGVARASAATDIPPYRDADVQAALDAAGDLIVESVEHGGPVYRLFHEALAEHLRRDAAAAAAHAAIADTLIAQAQGRPWTSVHPYIVANLTAHLAAAATGAGAAAAGAAESAARPATGDRAGALVQLVCDPLWERARRSQARGATAWLDDVDLALQVLAHQNTSDLRQVGLCLVYGRKLSSAPVPVLDVLARAGQLQRAERMANNLDAASERVQAYCLLACGHAEVADDDAAWRCLQQAISAADVMAGTHAPMARCWLAKAFAGCRKAELARGAAVQALDLALQVKAQSEAAHDTWDVANALWWAALALRHVGDTERLASLRGGLHGLMPLRNQTLQLASVLGDTAFLRAAFDQFKADSNTGQHSSIRPGNLALALADAGMAAEFDELLHIVPPHDASAAGEKDAQKRFVWALALAGRMDDALQALHSISAADERAKAAVRLAEVAVQRRQSTVLQRLADTLLAESAPRDAGLDVLTAKVLSLAGRHDAALAIVEDVLRRPGDPVPVAPAPARALPSTKNSRRPLAPDLARVDCGRIVPSVEQMLQAGRYDDALRQALAIGQPGAEAPAERALNLPASRALALDLLVRHRPEAAGALGVWLEALRTARLAGHRVVAQVMQSGAQVVTEATAGTSWAALIDDLAQLERRWELEDFAEQYDTLRSAFGSGRQRTARMTSLMIVPRRLAAAQGWRAEQVQAALAGAEPAKRAFALGLMQGNPALVDPAFMIDCIGRSNSAFEQYQALSVMVASDGLKRFDVTERQRLCEVLAAELAQDGTGRCVIGDDSGRRSLAERLLARLRSTRH